MPVELRWRQSEVAEALRNAPAGVVDGDDKRRTPMPPIFADRGWLVCIEQEMAHGARHASSDQEDREIDRSAWLALSQRSGNLKQALALGNCVLPFDQGAGTQGVSIEPLGRD